MNIIVNIAAYQLAWFACVLGAANQVPWIGTAVAVVVALLHVTFATDRSVQIKLILSCLALGMIVDSTLLNAGIVEFTSGMWLAYAAPQWMLGLWIAFATTLTVSLRWLMRKPLWAAIFGAVGGPIAYYAGAKLGAIGIPSLALGLCAIGVSWAITMWLLALLVARITQPLLVVGRPV